MKKQDFLVICITIIVSSAFMLIRQYSDLDEMWNYNFARNMAEGLLPYKDFNIIQMPLYPFVVSIFFRILGNELIVARFVAIILFTLIIFVAYKILGYLIKNKWIQLISTLGILFLYKSWFWGDYNFTILLIGMIVILLELKNIKKFPVINKDFKYNFLVGILVGLAILSKQTTGIVLAFTFVIYKWVFIRNKQDLLDVLKISVLRGVGILTPVFIFIIYLLFTNTFLDFVNYSIKGIFTFSTSIPFSDLLNNQETPFIFKFLTIMIPISIIVGIVIVLFTKIDSQKKNNLIVLIAFSIQNLIVTYPLFDIVHLLLGVMPLILTTIYILYLFLGNYIGKWINISLKVLSIILSIILVIYSIIVLAIYINIQFIKPNQFQNKCNNINAIPISEATYNYNKTLGDYILEQNKNGIEVYIVDVQAAATMIVLDKYNKDFDMLLKGNLGEASEDGIIEKIKKMNNTIFLVEESISENMQSTEKVKNYIKIQYNKIGEISKYNIYRKD